MPADWINVAKHLVSATQVKQWNLIRHVWIMTAEWLCCDHYNYRPTRHLKITHAERPEMQLTIYNSW